jgi:hypothetical protein
MRKPSKPGKAAKLKVPADQQSLKTQCGFCQEVFPNPTLAQHHLASDHPGEYS